MYRNSQFKTAYAPCGRERLSEDIVTLVLLLFPASRKVEARTSASEVASGALEAHFFHYWKLTMLLLTIRLQQLSLIFSSRDDVDENQARVVNETQVLSGGGVLRSFQITFIA